jgi:hypothetical protein
MFWQLTPAVDQSPETVMETSLADFERSGEGEGVLVAPFVLQHYWLKEPVESDLVVVYRFVNEDSITRISVAISDAVNPIVELVESAATRGQELLDELLARFDLYFFDLGSPLILNPVNIPKPWGQEIWYTGIEERGLSCVGAGESTIPLPWLLAAAPARICGEKTPGLVLLKILDPLPDEVFGDLYFELHEEKREVYVVSHVDQTAWPGGKGKIRFGFDQDVRAGYANDRAFKTAFIESVDAYEGVRRRIDRLLDAKAEEAGGSVGEQYAVTEIRGWLAQLPAELLEEERDKRHAMERFTGFLELGVGDVVQVPCFVPHSLQHGVRTIEFQTPVYERLILSFGQKVLTQNHWDTEKAAAIMHLDSPAAEAPQCLFREVGVWVERIVDFEDFEVQRITLSGNTRYKLPVTADYRLLMTVIGEISIGDTTLTAEQACLFAATSTSGVIDNNHEHLAVCLLALPH